MALRIGVLIWIIPMYLMIMRIRMLIGSPVIRIMPLSDCTPIFSNFSCYFISAYISNFYLLNSSVNGYSISTSIPKFSHSLRLSLLVDIKC